MGWRARIGLVYPDDSDADDEYASMVPPGASVHVARNAAPWDGDVIASVLRQRNDGLVAAAARSLEPVHPDAVAYACSSGSFAGGPDFHLQIVDDLERILGVPATTGTTACDVALRTLGVRDVSVVTPYESSRNELLVAVLEAQGFRVQALETFDAHGALPEFQRIGLGLVDVLNPDVAYRLGRRADRPASEAILIACTSFRTGPMIEPLEIDLGKPVVTANQAVMWHALRLAGVGAPLEGFGVLFRQAVAAAIARPSAGVVAPQA
jgi:maleate cis-trans isomerase